MPTCEACGSENRASARFCWNCAAPLVAFRPSDADHEWLAANLVASDDVVTGDTGPLRIAAASLVAEMPDASAVAQEELMEQSTSATPTLFGGRFELPPDAPTTGALSVIDTMPWRHCWACGSTANEAGESFCTECGAALERRSYRASLAPTNESIGPALIAQVSDAGARAVLPEIWEQVTDGGRTLTVLHDSGRGSISVPLDEVTALGVGAALARLLTALHAQNLMLGSLTPADLEALAGGKSRLRDTPGLRRMPDDRAAAAQADLIALAELLEQLTATPRTTQRLSEDEAAAAISSDEPGLASVLRQLRTESISSPAALAERLDALLAERTRPIALRQIFGAATDVGIVRDHNEDSLLTIQLGLNNNNQPQGWGVYIVSDGMGGHAAGEVASGLAIRAAAELLLGEYLTRVVGPDAVYDEEENRNLVRRAILRANEAIIGEGRAQGNDMGATFTMALVEGDRVIVGNVGDSRTYLYRDGKLRRISKDHSLVARLVDLGQISDEDVYTHPQRNAVLRSLGDKPDVEVDIFSERVRAGDALVLCSDGQWEMTRDPEMERILSRDEDPQRICEALVSAANQAGGEDNIAVVLVRFG